mgnify:CR=1 FL=1
MWIRHLAFVALAALLALPAARAHEDRAGDLVFGHPHTSPTLGGVKNGAVHLVVTNNGATDDTLIGARSPVAAAVEIHNHEAGEDGVMRMRKIDRVEVPAGGSVEFAPGGLHVMLIGLTAPLTLEEIFAVTLVFEKAGEVTIYVYVTEDQPPAEASGHTGHSGH